MSDSQNISLEASFISLPDYFCLCLQRVSPVFQVSRQAEERLAGNAVYETRFAVSLSRQQFHFQDTGLIDFNIFEPEPGVSRRLVRRNASWVFTEQLDCLSLRRRTASRRANVAYSVYIALAAWANYTVIPSVDYAMLPSLKRCCGTT